MSTVTSLQNSTAVTDSDKKAVRIKAQPVGTNIVAVLLDQDRKYCVRSLGLTDAGLDAPDNVQVAIGALDPTDTYAAGVDTVTLKVDDVFYPKRGTSELRFITLTTPGGKSEQMIEITVLEIMVAGHEA